MRQASLSLRRTYSPRWTTGACASADTAVASKSVSANAASGCAFASSRNSIFSFALSGVTSSTRDRAGPSVRCSRSPLASRRACPLKSPSRAARSNVGARNAVSYRSSIVRRTASAGSARSAGCTRSPADSPVTRASRIVSSGARAVGEPDGSGVDPGGCVPASLDVHAASAHASASRPATRERRGVLSDRTAYGTGTRTRAGVNVPSDVELVALRRERAAVRVNAPALDHVVAHAIQLVVRVHRVVVEQHQAVDLGLAGELRHVLGGRMPPPEPRAVLLGRVLAVVDQDVRPVRQAEPGDPVRGIGLEVGPERGFVIGEVGEHAAPGFDPIADGRAGMDDGRRAEPGAVDLPLGL